MSQQNNQVKWLNIYKSLPVVLDQRRSQVGRVDDVGGGMFEYVTFVPIGDIGELTVQVNFPMVFVEKPAFTHGSEVLPNSAVYPGRAPVCNAIVRNWFQQVRSDNGLGLYVGASVLFSVGGASGQQLVCCCQFRGKGLANPVQAE